MPLQAPGTWPMDLLQFSRWCTALQVEPSVGTITDETFAERAANSVIGRPSATDGAPSDITLAANQFLVNRSGTLQGDGLLDTDIPSGIARDTEVVTAANAAQAAAEATAAAALVAHVGAADPHTGYVRESQVLDGSATYDPPNLPDGDGATTTVTVTGAVLGDFVVGVSFSLDLQGVTVSAYVSASNTVSVRFQNESGGAIDLGSGTLKVRVWK